MVPAGQLVLEFQESLSVLGILEYPQFPEVLQVLMNLCHRANR